MIMIKPFSLLLLAALLRSGSGVTLDDFDTLYDFSPKTPAASKDIDVHDETENLDAESFIEKDAVLAKYLPPLTTSAPAPEVLTLAGLNRFQNLQNKKFLCHIWNECKHKTDTTTSRSTPSTIMSTPSTIMSTSSTILSTSSTIVSTSSAVGSTSPTLETTSSTVESTSYAAAGTALVVDDMNRVSRGLNLDAEQLAGIVVGVFFVSTISSILATLFIVRYRRRRADATGTTLVSSSEAKRQMHWPSFGKLRGNILSSKYSATATAGRREFPTAFPPKLEQRMSSQNHQTANLIDRFSFASPVRSDSTSDQIYPVSPLSDMTPDNFERDHQPTWGVGLFKNNTQRRSDTSNIPPIKFSLARKITQNGPQRMQVVRAGVRATIPRRLLSNMRTTKTFLSNDASTDSTVPREGPVTQESTGRMERRTVTLSPIANMSAFSPPAIPLRFSSLNTSKSPPTYNSVGFHGEDGTFLLSTDDGSADHGPRFSQDQSGLESSSNSSVILQDLTQFDPGGPSQQPTSRFSMSSAPLSSLGHSVSSTSPVPQYDQQQQEHPELSALRPALSTPPQLQAPVPRRPNPATNVGITGTIYT